jgi:hypothetical protein
MHQGLFTRLLVALGNAFGDAADFLSDDEGFKEVLTYLGWPAASLPAGYQAVGASAAGLRSTVAALLDNPSYEELATLAQRITELLTAIEQAKGTIIGVPDPDIFKQQLIGLLVMEGTKRYLPAAYHLLCLLGIIESVSVGATATHTAYTSPRLNLDNLTALLAQPGDYLTDYFGWGENFDLNTDLQLALLRFIKAIGGDAQLLNADGISARVTDGVADLAARGLLYLPLNRLVNGDVESLVSISLLPDSTITYTLQENYANAQVPLELYKFDADNDAGVQVTNIGDIVNDSLIINLLSNAFSPDPIDLGGDVQLKFADLRNALAFRISPEGITFANGSSVALSSLSLNPAVALAYTPPTPLIFIGEPGKTRVQADGVELSLSLSINRGVKLELKLVNSQFVIKGSEGDSFLGSVLPDSTIALPLSVTLSSLDGLRFNGANSFRLKSSPNRAIGPVLFKQVTLGLESTATHDVAIRAHSDLEVALGPVTVSASDVGASFTIKDITSPTDIALGFDLPKGLGINVESDAVNGGGYLFLDPDNHQYAGVAHLEIAAGTTSINVNALGILQTELPGRPDDYSLLLLITATFTPIQLGLGFTLNGLGGLLGVNRAADTDYLRGMVRQGQLKQLLFTDDVMDDPTGALALVDAAFPVAQGRYVIGLMAQLGWGSVANIITLDVALLVELPKPVRVLLLGVLQAVLPSEQNDKLKLRADFLGVVDFGAKRVSFDATLTDSHILSFALTGDLAFRLYQGDNPLFVITAGGFHPAFQPPAGAALTGLRRLALGLSKGDLQLSLASYYAVTSNTVQFGARLDLVYAIGRGFRVEGHFGFDVLFQFSPFRLLAHVEAGVAIKRGSSEYLSIHLSLDVTGPGPWHVWGDASFKVLFFKIRFSVNATIGSAPSEPYLAAPNVHDLLLEALRKPTSWEVEAPTTPALPGGVVLRPVAPAAGQVFLDPRGALALRQRVAPLGLTIDKYGSAPTPPTGGRFFELTQLKVGDDVYKLSDKDSLLEQTRDFFAPDQFTKLSDAQKLSAPSFQNLPTGLRLKQLNGLVAATHATRRVVEYEKKLLSGASGGSLGPTTTTGQAIGQDTYRRLTQGSALGRAVQAAQPSARAAQPVGWQESTYEVVAADTLEPHNAAHTKFKTQAEAAQYCQDLVAANATLELVVVPTYQLELA